MVCPEPQNLSILRARKNPGRRTVAACPWHGQGQTELGDKPHCNGFPDPQPSFCNPNPPFFKTNVSVGRLLPVPSQSCGCWIVMSSQNTSKMMVVNGAAPHN